jgi:hypothetical protein
MSSIQLASSPCCLNAAALVASCRNLFDNSQTTMSIEANKNFDVIIILDIHGDYFHLVLSAETSLIFLLLLIQKLFSNSNASTSSKIFFQFQSTLIIIPDVWLGIYWLCKWTSSAQQSGPNSCLMVYLRP